MGVFLGGFFIGNPDLAAVLQRERGERVLLVHAHHPEAQSGHAQHAASRCVDALAPRPAQAHRQTLGAGRAGADSVRAQTFRLKCSSVRCGSVPTFELMDLDPGDEIDFKKKVN